MTIYNKRRSEGVQSWTDILETMRLGRSIRLLLAVGGLTAFCWGQSAPATKPADAPCPAAKTAPDKSAMDGAGQTAAKPCVPDDQRPAAERFPFPGETSQPEAPAANAPAPGAPKPSAASAHPYPGDPAAGADSSSSSSSSSSDDDGYDPNAPLPSTMRNPPKPKKVQTPDERVDEDLRVAQFYLDSGDLPGAYLRSKDAVRVEPDYSETHYMLAQVLQKMKKKDEAIAEYKAYLKMDPDGDRTKAVKRALAELK